MALSKAELYSAVESAFYESGWSCLRLSPKDEHPARYCIFRDSQRANLLIYVWNLTPGGRNRPLDEWRIQATGVARFEQASEGETLILGWHDLRRVFAGFDLKHHGERLGRSPSIQLRQAALDRAEIDGLCAHNKGSGEVAIAFRPDFLGTYATNLGALHQCAEVPGEIELLNALAHHPSTVDDADLQTVAETRRYAVAATRRSLRANDFRRRVMTAYGYSCAMCGTQLRLLEGAHILPAAHPDSTDETCNGLALCVLHHRAYDRAFVAFDAEFRIRLNESMARELEARRQDGGLQAFRDALRPILALPPDRRDRPAHRFVSVANQLRGWPI